MAFFEIFSESFFGRSALIYFNQGTLTFKEGGSISMDDLLVLTG